MKLKDILNEKYTNTFTHAGKDYDLTPIQVKAKNLKSEPFKVSDLEWILPFDKADEARVKSADISNPIFVTKYKDVYAVIDGYHRLTKAKRNNLKEIPAKVIPKEWLDNNVSKNINESTIKLEDLYDWDELNDEGEQLYHWVDKNDLEKEFEVKQMSPEQAKGLDTARDDMTVFDAYNKFASKQQKKLVDDKIKHYDFNRVVVLANTTVVDGNHQVIAAILSGNPLKYIDLYD